MATYIENICTILKQGKEIGHYLVLVLGYIWAQKKKKINKNALPFTILFEPR